VETGFYFRVPGQFLTLRLNAIPGAPPLLRSYSLSGPPGTGSYRVSVKREPHGTGSQFMHARRASRVTARKWRSRAAA
jgi:ferredoxin-NADP reductase